MRKELEELALIDAYINNELDGDQLNKTEELIQQNPDFAAKVENQKLIIKAIKRSEYKKEIRKNKKGGKNGYFFGGALVILAIGILSYFALGSELNEVKPSTPKIDKKEVISNPSTFSEKKLTNDSESLEKKPIIPSKTKSKSKDKKDVIKVIKTKTNELKTWIEPEIQVFQLDASKGGIIEGENGMVISIPSNSWVDKNGNLAKGPVDVELIEALDLDKMVMYNLTTMSGKRNLRSGGMFSIKAFQDKKEVKIKDGKEMIISVPTDEIDPEMQLFTGKITNGKMDWIDPKPMKKYLIPVDQKTLNFLPKTYEDAFKAKGEQLTKRAFDKYLADSVYYTLDRKHEPMASMDILDERIYRKGKIRKDAVLYDGPDVVEANLAQYDTPTKTNYNFDCGINSTSIQTILQDDFKNTYLATREFEKRLNGLHSASCGEDMLQIYINGLNDDLWKSDKKVSEQIDSSRRALFVDFYNEQLTNTRFSVSHQKNWKSYFDNQNKINEKKQKVLLDMYSNLKAEQIKSIREAYLKEVVKKGVVYQRKPSKVSRANVFRPLSSSGNNYIFGWASSGWTNIDAYLKTIRKNSKSVAIEVAKIGESTQEVYQYLNTINTLTPLIKVEGNFIARFPKFSKEMTKTYAMSLAKKGKTFYWDFKVYNPYKTENISLSPSETPIYDIRSTLRSYGIKQDVVQRIKKEEKLIVKRLKAEAKRKAELQAQKERMEKAKKEYNKKMDILKQQVNLRNEFRQAAYGCGIKSSSEEELKPVVILKSIDSFKQE
tara:strand:+ start:5714 stop:8032 length:2319 start_codon:yes stop_codon:yes gene_type:complete